MNDLGSREPSRRYELLELSVISTILSPEPMALNVMNNFITDEMKYFTSRTLVL